MMNLKRTLISIFSLAFSLLLISCTDKQDLATITPSETSSMEHGLIIMESPFSFEETGSRIRTTLEERGLLIPADLNHQQNAAGVDMNLRPTRTIIFGNPNLGTPLMQCSQSIAIDLPQKILIWEDEPGNVQIAYNDPGYLKNRHGAQGCDQAFETVANALENLMESALSE